MADPSPPLEKLTVVLDLHETLVCSYVTSRVPARIRSQATENGIKWFEFEHILPNKEPGGEPMINGVTVFERPGLKEFLKQLSEFADLVLYTGGIEDYAGPVVDIIDAENLFSRRLYRPSTRSNGYVKDLSCLSKDPRRVVIVDNNPVNFLGQPFNGIPCIPFSYPPPLLDDKLLNVILPWLKHLSLQKDVRPILHENFRMDKWFKKHIPAVLYGRYSLDEWFKKRIPVL